MWRLSLSLGMIRCGCQGWFIPEPDVVSVKSFWVLRGARLLCVSPRWIVGFRCVPLRLVSVIVLAIVFSRRIVDQMGVVGSSWFGLRKCFVLQILCHRAL